MSKCFPFLTAARKCQTHLQTHAIFHSGLEGRLYIKAFQNLKTLCEGEHFPIVNAKVNLCAVPPLRSDFALRV